MRRCPLFLVHGWLFALVWCTAASAQPSSDSMPVSAAQLQAYVQALAHDSMQGRATASIGLFKALDYCRTIFKEAGLEPVPQVAPAYYHRFIFNGMVSYNLVGLIRGQDTTKYIVFSSHIDHVGNAEDKAQPFSPFNRTTAADKLFNGANDNASGTAAILALANYYSKQEKPAYNLLFIAFSGEELGLLGSKAFCALPLARQVVQQINLEMLGRPGRNEPFITEGTKSYALRKNLNQVLAKNGYGKKFFKRDTYTDEGLFRRSDNYSFAQIGVPANTIMATSPRDDFYHHVDDEWESLDYNAMAKIVQAVIIGCAPLVMGL